MDPVRVEQLSDHTKEKLIDAYLQFSNVIYNDSADSYKVIHMITSCALARALIAMRTNTL